MKRHSCSLCACVCVYLCTALGLIQGSLIPQEGLLSPNIVVQYHETVTTQFVLLCPTYMCDIAQGRSVLS